MTNPLPRRSGRAKLLRYINAFNREFPTGTSVVVSDHDEEVVAKVSAPARLVGDKPIGYFDFGLQLLDTAVIRLAG